MDKLCVRAAVRWLHDYLRCDGTLYQTVSVLMDALGHKLVELIEAGVYAAGGGGRRAAAIGRG